MSETIRSKCENMNLSSRSLRAGAPWSPGSHAPPSVACKLPKDADTALSISKSQEAGTSTCQLWIDSRGWIFPLLRPSRSRLEDPWRFRRQSVHRRVPVGRIPRILSFSEHFLEEGAGILLPGSTMLSITLIQFAAAPVGTHYPGVRRGRL